MSDERVETVAELEAWARLVTPDSRWYLRRKMPYGFYLEHTGILVPLCEPLFRKLSAQWKKNEYGNYIGTRTPGAILALLARGAK